MRGRACSLIAVTTFFLAAGVPCVFAQSPEVSAEWALFNQILFIGIIVGLVVFGLMFYAIIRYRERPEQTGGK